MAGLPSSSAVMRLAWRSARARMSRIAATVLGLAVAVSFTVAAFGVAAQFDRFVGEGTDAAAQELDGLPAGAVTIAAPAGGVTQTTAVDESLLGLVRASDGVLEATGTYDQPIGVRLLPGQQAEVPVVLRGLVFTSAWSEERWRLTAGRAPIGGADGAGDELPIALDPGGQRAAEAELGDRVRLQTPIGGVSARVVGLVEPAEAGRGSLAETAGVSDARVVADGQVLPALLDAEGRLDRITAYPAPGVGLDVLADRLRAQLPPDLEVSSAADPDAVTAQTVAVISDGVSTATLAFAGLSAVVASLLVANTLTILVTQRNRELALLRCVGLTAPQAGRTVLAEATLVGAAGAVVGFLAGLPLSLVGASFIRPGQPLNLVVTPAMVVAAATVGLGVTLAAALLPAVRAMRVAPLAALAAAERPPRRGLVGMALTPPLAAMAALAPSSTGRMAIGNARRDVRRSGATASTLVVGLGLISLVLTVSASITAATQEQFVNDSNADVYLERRGLVRISAGAVDDALARRGVRSGMVSVLAVDGTLIGPSGVVDRATAADLERIPSLFDLGLEGGEFPRSASQGGPGGRSATSGAVGRVMVSEQAAATLGVEVGEAVTLRSVSGRERPLQVVGSYRATAFFGPAVVERADAEAISADGSFELAALDVPRRFSPERAANYLAGELQGFPKLRAHTPDQFAALNVGVAETVTRLALVVLSGSLLVGALGAANTISLSVMERRRELALLRAVGATADQVRSLVRSEALAICGLAGALATLAGVGLATLGMTRAPPEFAAEPVIPWTALVAVGVAALAIGWAAAVLATRPSQRAGPFDGL
ncbi:MAG: FtsX-like permease family protein [Microthrixaceae bacterium]